MSKALFEAWQQHQLAIETADKTLAARVRFEYPKGSTIKWDRGGHMQIGHVVGYGPPAAIRVHNIHTDKTYWITVYDVVIRYFSD